MTGCQCQFELHPHYTHCPSPPSARGLCQSYRQRMIVQTDAACRTLSSVCSTFMLWNKLKTKQTDKDRKPGTSITFQNVHK